MSLSKSLWTKLLAVSLGATMALGIGLTASKVADEVNAADIIDSFSVKGFGGYSGTSYTTAVQTATGSTSGVTYQASNFIGSSGQIKGNGTLATNFYLRNTTEYSGYYISKISLTVTGGTLTGNVAGSCVVAYGTSAIAANNTTGLILDDQNAAAQATLTWTVANPATSKFTFFCVNNMKTNGSAVAGTANAVQVTWVPAGASQKTLTNQLEVSGSLTKTTQYVGKTLDVAGLTIKAVYDDLSKSTLIASQLTLPTLVYGTNSYQISYTENLVTATANVAVTVAQDSASSLSWTGRVTSFNEGSLFTLGAGAVTATRASGDTESVVLDDLTIYLFSGSFNASTSPVLSHATALQLADNGKSIVLGFEGVYTSASTISVNFVPTTTYGTGGAVLVTNVANIAVDDHVIIVSAAGTYALSTTQNGNNRGAVAVTTSSNAIATVPSEVQVLTLATGSKANTFAFNTGSGYLYAASSSSNYLRTQASIDDNASFTIAITEAGVATVTAQGENTRNLMQYNTSSTLFSCYSSAQAAISVFKIEDSGYNYDYVLGMLDGDYCSATLVDLNKVVTRYDAMTTHEKDYLNALTITGKDSNSYTGAQAYAALLARRSALQSQGVHTSTVGDNDNISVIAIITILFVFGAAVGGYFYIRKKKSA